MTFLDVGPRVLLLYFLGLFMGVFLLLFLLFIWVLGLGPRGPPSAFLVSFLLTLLAFLIARRGRS